MELKKNTRVPVGLACGIAFAAALALGGCATPAPKPVTTGPGQQNVRRDECERSGGRVWRQCQLTGDDRIDWGTCVNVCRGGTYDGQLIDKRAGTVPGKEPPSFKMSLTLGTPSTAGGQPQMRMQSFEGDVCVADGSGGGSISHCMCEGNSCTCQGQSASCVP